MKQLLILCAVLALTGCPSPEEKKFNISTVEALNKQGLKNPETIGQLPDGQPVVRYQTYVVCHSCANGYDADPHYVYVVGQAVSDNHKVRVAKHSENRVHVTVGTDVAAALGASVTADEVVAAAKKIEAEREAADKAEWTRLNGKYGGAK